MPLRLGRRSLLAFASSAAATSAPRAQGEDMTRIDLGKAVHITALTGAGSPVAWAVLDDATAPAGPKVLAQTSTDRTDYRFPLAIFDQPVAADLNVAVRFKTVAGEVDRAAGIAFRLRDAGNYYVARANALEDNVRLYRMVHGQRMQFAGASTKVQSGIWHELRVGARENRFEIFFNGKSLYSATDDTFTGAGRVALWTKADSVTYFSDLRIQTR